MCHVTFDVLLCFRCPTTDALPIICNTGEYASAGSTSCTICPAGSYCPEPPPGAPTLCADGWYANGTGLTNCTECPVGKCSQNNYEAKS